MVACNGAYIHHRLQVAPPTFLYPYPAFPEIPPLPLHPVPVLHHNLSDISDGITQNTDGEGVCRGQQEGLSETILLICGGNWHPLPIIFPGFWKVYCIEQILHKSKNQ